MILPAAPSPSSLLTSGHRPACPAVAGHPRNEADRLADLGPASAGLTPLAGGPALRDWLGGLAGGHALAAAFDTRLAGAPVLTGRASRGIGKVLRRHGYRFITPSESFLVTKLNTLVDGESSRARQWGTALAATAGLAVPAA